MHFLSKYADQLRDAALGVITLSLAALAIHAWLPMDKEQPMLVIASAPAQNMPANGSNPATSVVQFVFLNRGEAQAENVRLRALVAQEEQPDKLTTTEDFVLSSPLDPQTNIARTMAFRHADPNAPPKGYLIVLEADYDTPGGDAKVYRRYFLYRTGDNAAVQVSAEVKAKMERAVEAAFSAKK